MKYPPGSLQYVMLLRAFETLVTQASSNPEAVPHLRMILQNFIGTCPVGDLVKVGECVAKMVEAELIRIGLEMASAVDGAEDAHAAESATHDKGK